MNTIVRVHIIIVSKVQRSLNDVLDILFMSIPMENEHHPYNSLPGIFIKHNATDQHSSYASSCAHWRVFRIYNALLCNTRIHYTTAIHCLAMFPNTVYHVWAVVTPKTSLPDNGCITAMVSSNHVSLNNIIWNQIPHGGCVCVCNAKGRGQEVWFVIVFVRTWCNEV